MSGCARPVCCPPVSLPSVQDYVSAPLRLQSKSRQSQLVDRLIVPRIFKRKSPVCRPFFLPSKIILITVRSCALAHDEHNRPRSPRLSSPQSTALTYSVSTRLPATLPTTLVLTGRSHSVDRPLSPPSVCLSPLQQRYGTTFLPRIRDAIDFSYLSCLLRFRRPDPFLEG